MAKKTDAAKKVPKKKAKAPNKVKAAAPSPVVKKKSGLRKYASLIVYVLLFLLLTVGMFSVNAFYNQKLAEQSKKTQISGNLDIIFQQMSKNILDLHIYITTELLKNPERDWVAISALPQKAQYRMEELKNLRNIMENDLNAFQDGGVIVNFLTQEETPFPALGEDFPAYENLENVRNIWQLYRGLMDSLAADADQLGILYIKTSEFLIDYDRQYASKYLFELDHITNAFVEQNAKMVSDLETIQLAAIFTAFVLFLLIVFGALRQLFKNDALLDLANEEMNEIMSSVNEGLFLVDRHLIIGNEYSARLESIIGQKELAGKNLLEVLSELVSDEDLETTQTFIEQLYSKWVVEDLIDDLNPLNRIAIKDGNNQERFLDFKFFRVTQNNEIVRVLVNVQDTTEIVMLQESQKSQREQEGQELEMLNIILNTNPAVLSSFIRESQIKLDNINHSLKSQGTTQRELKEKVHHIARLIHSVKGEASSIKLTRMVSICETFEESLDVMKNAHILRGQDFLGLVVWLEDLFRLFDILENYNSRLNQGGSAPMPILNNHAARETQADYFQKFVQDIAQRTGKKVHLICEGFDELKLSDDLQAKMRGIAVQLLRNAMVHGIETPLERTARNKDETGVIRLVLAQDQNQHIMLSIEDDGHGINFDAIREKALQNGYTMEQAQAMSQSQLYNLMFSSGFSTAEKQTEDAGRGVGMDIIKATVKEMGGRINIATQPESYTRFKFIFPKNH